MKHKMLQEKKGIQSEAKVLKAQDIIHTIND